MPVRRALRMAKPRTVEGNDPSSACYETVEYAGVQPIASSYEIAVQKHDWRFIPALLVSACWGLARDLLAIERMHSHAIHIEQTSLRPVHGFGAAGGKSVSETKSGEERRRTSHNSKGTSGAIVTQERKGLTGGWSCHDRSLRATG